MKPFGIILLILASQQLCLAVSVSNEGKRVDRHNERSYNNKVSGKNIFPYRRQDDDDDDDSSSGKGSRSDGSSSSDSKSKDLQIPQINFYNSVPNALGVVGQGFLWIREFSAAIGTPLPIYILTLPVILFGIGLIFIPDLTQLGLPLFYGGDSSSDLASLSDLIDSTNLEFIKQAGQLLPPGLLTKRG